MESASRPRSHPAAAVPLSLDTRPWVFDLGSALVLGTVGAFSRPTISFETSSQTLYTVIVAGCCAAVIIRRRWPRIALSVIALLLLLHVAVVPEPGVFALAMCLLTAYSAQTRLVPPTRWVATALVMAGAVCGLLVPSVYPGSDPRGRLIAITAALALIAAAALAGALRRSARHRYDAAVERAAVLEAQHEVERRLAAAEERALIAREMHDILGHSLNAIAIQAEGVRHVFRDDPDRGDTTLASIARLSRAAVDEVRDLIDVLRGEDEPPQNRPAPTLSDVPELIGTFHDANEHIRLQATGDLAAVPAHVALTGYRIIQEALTNAARHAPGAPVTVRITARAGAVDLTIANAATRYVAPAPPSSGHGLVGMRERVRALGGTIDGGPDSTTGGWTISVTLPWSRP